VVLAKDRQELIVNLRPAGRWLGLASVIKQARYEFTSEPLTKCVLQRLPIETFHWLLKTDLGFAHLIAEALADNLVELYDRVSQIANITPRHQLESYLWRAIAEQGLNGNGSGEIRLRLPLKRKEIARMINISPQYVSELLTELVEEGVLRRNGRELIIVDQSGLWHEIDFEELILNH